jgi:hypothetical protein
MGDVSVSTRGGANQLHGSTIWYHQNAALDATVYGAPSKQSKVYNTLGASLSGPIQLPHLYRGRNRTFFFIDYETNRQPHSTLLQFSVPTAEMRAGDLNGLPGGTAVDPLSGAPFPDNVIPASRINSVARTLLGKYYPLPNYNADGTTNTNLRLLQKIPYDTNGYDIRIDQIISPRQQVYGRWTWKHLTTRPFLGLLPPGDSDHWVKNAVVSHNFLLRPNLINEFRFGASLDRTLARFPILGTDAVATLGLQGLELENAGGRGGFPLFAFSDGTGFASIGRPRDGPSRSSTWQFTDNLSWIRGRHSMKFGVDVRRVSYESVFSFGGGDDFGTFAFHQGAFSGNAFADLLLGLPYLSEYGLLGPNLNQRAVHSHVYGQDEWRVNDRLTISFGLRWTVHPPMTEASGNITNFDPATGDVIVPDRTLPGAPNFLAAINACPGSTTAIPCTKIVTAGQAGLGQGLRRTDYGNWAPRLSLAWRPFGNNKTVVRSGFGVFTQTILGSTAYALTGIHTNDVRDYINYQGPGITPRWVLPLVRMALSSWRNQALEGSEPRRISTTGTREPINGASRSNVPWLPRQPYG